MEIRGPLRRGAKKKERLISKRFLGIFSCGANGMETYGRSTNSQAWPEKGRRNRNKRRLSEPHTHPRPTPPSTKIRQEAGWWELLLNCKHVLLFIKRKGDSESKTKYPEGGTESQEALFTVFTNLSRNSHLPTGLGYCFGPVIPFYFHFPVMNQSVHTFNAMPVSTSMGGGECWGKINLPLYCYRFTD